MFIESILNYLFSVTFRGHQADLLLAYWKVISCVLFLEWDHLPSAHPVVCRLLNSHGLVLYIS